MSKTRYYTIDIESGDGDNMRPADALYLAEQHAQEGTRLTNEMALYLNIQRGGVGYLFMAQMAQSHAQLASAYAAIAQAKT